MHLSASRCREAVLAGLVATLSMSCVGTPGPGFKAAAPAGGISPPPRAVRVEQDSVVVEGRWFPIETEPPSPVVPNAVRLVCGRVERSCKEDLTRLAGASGAELVHEVLKYRIDDWTKWGKPAGRLLASRRDGLTQIEIRVSLSGLTAEKVVIEGERETHWRIE